MSFSFKLDNPAAKVGFLVMIPLAVLALFFSISSQTCGGSHETASHDAAVMELPTPR